MAATAAPVLQNVAQEGNLQIAYFTIASVANTNTTDFSNWSKNVIHVSVFPSTSAAVGGTISAGVVTWQVSAGTPNLIVRIALGE